MNDDVIRERGLNQAMVEQAVADEMAKLPGVALAVSSTALMKGQVSETALTRSILNNHNPKRSGDVFVVFQPHWFINDFDGLQVAATHGSPWRYDTYVPIMYAGAGLQDKGADQDLFVCPKDRHNRDSRFIVAMSTLSLSVK